MVILADKSVCTGCAACKAVCPRHAISMRADKEEFLYPQIDASKCVGCGMCMKSCPSLAQAKPCKPIGVYAAVAKDDDLRRTSSSGGMFSLLSNEVLSLGGVVFGAAFDHSDWHVYHRVAENEEELLELRGSKYVQSDIGECYNEVKDFLKSGRHVLFSGTPCQIAALKKVLNADKTTPTDKLLLVDVVCHAVPSPLAWKKYLEKRITSVNNGMVVELRNIKRVSFRSKYFGWKQFAMSLEFSNNKTYLATFSDDPFMQGFLSELYNRTSCHNCPCKNLRGGSDVTIADYWGVDSRFPEVDDDKGTSLVIVNTARGNRAFTDIVAKIVVKESNFDHAVKTNPAIVKATIPHRNRGRFFNNVMTSDFDTVVKRMLMPSFKNRMRVFGGRVLRKLGVYK